jgi:hypothetical protein
MVDLKIAGLLIALICFSLIEGFCLARTGWFDESIDVNEMISYHMAICAESDYNDSFRFDWEGSIGGGFNCCKNINNTSQECRKLMPMETKYEIVRGFVVVND